MPVTTPKVLATGAFPGWDYIVMTRVPGQPLGALLEQLTKSELAQIVHALGAALAALHALPVPTDGVVPAEKWSEFVARQSALCVKRQRALGVHEHLTDGIPRRLARASLAAWDVALVHADLTSWNVMVAERGGRWEMTGIIDFGDARIGAPIYDISTPAILIAQRDRDIFHSLLDGYGIPADARTQPLQDRLMASAILHPFGDLTRSYDVEQPPRSLSELQNAMFPL